MASGRCGGVGGCALLLDSVGALVETVVVSMVLVPEAVPCEKIKKQCEIFILDVIQCNI